MSIPVFCRPAAVLPALLLLALVQQFGFPGRGLGQRPPAGPFGVLVTPGGRTPAQLLSISEDWLIRFETERGVLPVSAGEVVYWGAYDDVIESTHAVLADGSVVVGELLRLDAETVRLGTRRWGTLELARAKVRGMVFSQAADARSRDQVWQQLSRGDESGEGDRLLLSNGDRLVGGISAGGEQAGALGVGAVRLQPVGVADPITIETSQISALQLRRSGGQRAGGSGRHLGVGLRSGAWFAVRRLQYRPDAGSLQLHLVCGISLEGTAERLWRDTSWIQPLEFGGVVYLSDLETLGYRQIPFLDLTRDWGRDRNVLGGHLRVGGHVYAKGIGMAPYSRLAFALSGREETFAAEVALDDRAGAGGSVVFRVFLAGPPGENGKLTWEAVYESPVVRGDQSPLPIAVDLGSATRIALLVEFAERGDERDYANWLNARFVRR